MVLLACPAFCPYRHLPFTASSYGWPSFSSFHWTRDLWNETSGLALILMVSLLPLWAVQRPSVIPALSFVKYLQGTWHTPARLLLQQMVLCYRTRCGSLRAVNQLLTPASHSTGGLRIRCASAVLSACTTAARGARLHIPIQFSGTVSATLIPKTLKKVTAPEIHISRGSTSHYSRSQGFEIAPSFNKYLPKATALAISQGAGFLPIKSSRSAQRDKGRWVTEWQACTVGPERKAWSILAWVAAEAFVEVCKMFRVP